MALSTAELLAIARGIWKTDEEVRNKTGLSRTTLWRMEKGEFRFRARTLGKLVKAISGDGAR